MINGPNNVLGARDGDMVELRILRKYPCVEPDQSKAIQHELVVARVKAALKEIDEEPSNVGCIGSKAIPRSHIEKSRVASTYEIVSQ